MPDETLIQKNMVELQDEWRWCRHTQRTTAMSTFLRLVSKSCHRRGLLGGLSMSRGLDGLRRLVFEDTEGVSGSRSRSMG